MGGTERPNAVADADVDELLDILLDVKHDLGKYVRLPLAMLAEDASESEARAALTAALLATRTGPSGTRPARAIWDGFREEIGDRLADRTGWAPLVAAVDEALAQERHVTCGCTSLPPYSVLLAVLSAVGERIDDLIGEVRDGA